MAGSVRSEALRFYSEPGEITSIGGHGKFVDWLAHDLRAMNQVVQGLLVHDGWLRAYGIGFNDAQRYDQQSLEMETLLDRAAKLDDRPMAIARAPEKRVIGCCREFATLLCAFLRHKKIPARCRCGFAKYFGESDKLEDHWVCECWDEAQGRWLLVDPQMDPFQQSVLALAFSPLDIPRAQFVASGEAWLRCRSGEWDSGDFGIGANAEEYGLATLYGLWFVRGNLMRDFASLNKVETVPLLMRLWRGLGWDSWRLAGCADDALNDEDFVLLDLIAEFTRAPDEWFDELRELFETREDLRPAQDILRYQ